MYVLGAFNFPSTSRRIHLPYSIYGFGKRPFFFLNISGFYLLRDGYTCTYVRMHACMCVAICTCSILGMPPGWAAPWVELQWGLKATRASPLPLKVSQMALFCTAVALERAFIGCMRSLFQSGCEIGAGELLNSWSLNGTIGLPSRPLVCLAYHCYLVWRFF